MYSNIKLIDPRTGKKKTSWARVSFIAVAILPSVIMWCIFYLFVNLNSFAMAFQYKDATTGAITLTLNNFTQFFDEFSKSTSLIREAFRNTFITFGSNIVILIGGFFVSFFLYKKIFLHKFFRTVFFLPTILAGTIISSVFTRFISVDGPVVSLMMKFGDYEFAPDLLDESRYANTTVIVHHMVFAFASNLILWGGALGRIPESVVESAKLDGVNWLKEAVYITIPMVWPTFALTLLMTFCGLFNATGSVFLLTRGQRGTMTLNCWMYLQVFEKSSDSNALNYMSAIGMMLTAVSLIITLTIRRFTSKINEGIAY